MNFCQMVSFCRVSRSLAGNLLIYALCLYPIKRNKKHKNYQIYLLITFIFILLEINNTFCVLRILHCLYLNNKKYVLFAFVGVLHQQTT